MSSHVQLEQKLLPRDWGVCILLWQCAIIGIVSFFAILVFPLYYRQLSSILAAGISSGTSQNTRASVDQARWSMSVSCV